MKFIPKAIDLVKVASSNLKVRVTRYRKELSAVTTAAARAWRTESKIKMSGPCAASGTLSTTGYPGRCSGNIERSLHYRTYSKIRGREPNYEVVSGVIAEFVPFTNNEGLDYGEYLNTAYYPYLKYKEKIYEALSKKVSNTIRKHDFKPMF